MPQTTAGIQFASAHSGAQDTKEAMEQILARITDQLSGAGSAGQGGAVDLVTVFASGKHGKNFRLIHDMLASSLAPQLEIGATAESVIGVRQELEYGNGLSVLAASMPGAVLEPIPVSRIDWKQTVEEPALLQDELLTGGLSREGLHAMLFIGDPFSMPMVNVPPALDDTFPGVPVIGGMASAGRQAGENAFLVNGEITHQGGVAVAIGGNLRVDCTVSQGCRPIGKTYVITKSKRHIVQELGGRNALEVVQEMAGDLNDEDKLLIKEGGLHVGRVINEYKDRFGRGDFLIRGLLGFSPESGHFAINDPQVRVGQTIQFHVRDQRTAAEDFQLMLELQKLHGPAAGALLFTCNGRGTRLFDHRHADANMVAEALGDIPLAGFFAAGEIGPVGGKNFLHGHTASLAVFRPAEA